MRAAPETLLPVSPCSSRRFSSSSGTASGVEAELRYAGESFFLDASTAWGSQPTSPCENSRFSVSSSTTRSSVSSAPPGDPPRKWSAIFSKPDVWVIPSPPSTPRSKLRKEEIHQVPSPSRRAARSARRVTGLREESDHCLVSEVLESLAPTAGPVFEVVESLASANVPLNADVLVSSQRSHTRFGLFTRHPTLTLAVCLLVGLVAALARTLAVATEGSSAPLLLNTSQPSDQYLVEVVATDAALSPSSVHEVVASTWFTELPPRVTGSLLGFFTYVVYAQ
jgi:hypothetical protein